MVENILEPAYMDVRTTSRYMGVSVGYLRKAVKERRVPCVRLGSRILRFRKQDVDAWMVANGHGGEVSYDNK